MITATTKHDPELSNKIWKAFKPTLTEKHGDKGSMGKEGEDAAMGLIAKHFPEVKYAIAHEDALHQMLGIDITLIHQDASSTFVDVKTGASNLYWTRVDGWYITIKPSYLTTHKRMDSLMHLGPKKDVFAYYDLPLMIEFCKIKLPKAFTEDVMIPRRLWPSFIRTNL